MPVERAEAAGQLRAHFHAHLDARAVQIGNALRLAQVGMATEVLRAHLLVALPAASRQDDRLRLDVEDTLGVFRAQAHGLACLVRQDLHGAGGRERGAALVGEHLAELLQVFVGEALGALFGITLATHPHVRAAWSQLFGGQAQAVDPFQVSRPVVDHQLAQRRVGHGRLLQHLGPVGAEARAERACGEAAGAAHLVGRLDQNDVRTGLGRAHGGSQAANAAAGHHDVARVLDLEGRRRLLLRRRASRQGARACQGARADRHQTGALEKVPSRLFHDVPFLSSCGTPPRTPSAPDGNDVPSRLPSSCASGTCCIRTRRHGGTTRRSPPP